MDHFSVSRPLSVKRRLELILCGHAAIGLPSQREKHIITSKQALTVTFVDVGFAPPGWIEGVFFRKNLP